MSYELRIIGGQLRRRKVAVIQDPGLRPLSDRAREALFNILGDKVVDRPFLDVFAGSGAVGLEAISRGAASAVFVEANFSTARKIESYLQALDIQDRGKVLSVDAYRWADNWKPPAEPSVMFLGPPYREYDEHLDAVTWIVRRMQAQLPTGSTLILQSDRGFDVALLPDLENWEVRSYGRAQLMFWP